MQKLEEIARRIVGDFRWETAEPTDEAARQRHEANMANGDLDFGYPESRQTIVDEALRTILAYGEASGTGSDWRYPVWVDEGDDVWLFKQDGKVVGEAYIRENGIIKWHCKTSNRRSTEAKSIDQAKAECEASFWKDAWHQIRPSKATRL